MVFGMMGGEEEGATGASSLLALLFYTHSSACTHSVAGKHWNGCGKSVEGDAKNAGSDGKMAAIGGREE